MASIGPAIPPHLLKRRDASEEDDESAPGDTGKTPIGPEVPAHLLRDTQVAIYDDDDDDGPQPAPSASAPVGPSLPIRHSTYQSERSDGGDIGPLPESRPPVAGPSTSSRRQVGPSLPTYAPTYDPTYNHEHVTGDDSSDDDVGPQPLPSGMKHQRTDAVKEFMEREEKRRKLAEEASKPKVAKRDEWMLVPPTSSGLLGNLDPTKLKARQFSRGVGAANPKTNDSSLWTETPQERQQRLADEISGKKRRVTDVPVDEEAEASNKRRRREEERIRQGVDEYTRTRRGAALIDQHAKTQKSQKEEDTAIWDHARDMGVGGLLMDDDKRKKILKEAKGLGDRFTSGKSGGFL